MTAGSGSDGRPAVVPDPTGAAPGRGAHLHPTSGCYDLAVRRKAFARALRLAPGPDGLSTAPVGEYLAAAAASDPHDPNPTEPSTRDWSSSS